MRQVLLATTALLATAALAQAQDKLPGIEPVIDEGPSIVLSGSAEIGVSDEGNDTDLEFHTDIDVTFTMTGTADNGLQFGANIDLDESDTDSTLEIAVDDTGVADDVEVGGSPAFDDDLQGGESIFIANGFGTLTMGDTDGALDWALQEIAIGGSLDDNEEHAGFNGNAGLDGNYDGQIARYEYTFGNFALALSGELSDEDPGDPVYGIGATYSTEIFGTGIGFGAGYQRVEDLNGDITSTIANPNFDPNVDDVEEAVLEVESAGLVGEDAEVYGVSADLTLSFGLRVILNYSRFQADAVAITADGSSRLAGAETDFYGVALGYTFGQFNVGANYGRFDVDDQIVTTNALGAIIDRQDVSGNDEEGYGVNVNYDLGGGIEAQFGYGNSDVDGDEDEETYSLGFAMAF